MNENDRRKLVERLSPHVKYVCYDLLNQYPIPPDVLKDAIQEAQVKLFEFIVIRGKDHHKDSYYKQFARNRARNFLKKHLFKVNKREKLVGHVDQLLNQRHKEDIQFDYEEIVSAFSQRGKVWGKKTDSKLQAATEKHSLDAYIDRKSSDVWSAKWLALKAEPIFTKKEKAFISQLRLACSMGKGLESIRNNMKMSLWDFESLIENVKRKSRYISFDIVWWVSKLQKLCPEKFERVLEKILKGDYIYIPFGRKRWTKKKSFYTQKVSSKI